MLYSLDEICLIPSTISTISHRSECNILYSGNKLPIYVAPMSSLVDESNYELFENMGVNTIIPRSIDFGTRIDLMKKGCMVAVGLTELEHLYQRFSTTKIQEGQLNYIPRICLDQANGHMEKSMGLCRSIKSMLGYKKVYIMVGNIANPATYREWAKVGVDAIRVGIGGGSVCTTSMLTGVHYPMASLLINCSEIKKDVEITRYLSIQEVVKNTPNKDIEDIICNDITFKSVPVIIADGGINRIDQAVKALTLGADYVMLGKVVAKSKEACGEISWDSRHSRCVRNYYGMSTTKAQVEINDSSIYKCDVKNEEGCAREVEVEYSFTDWLFSFESALRSSMSYVNKKDIKDYVGNVEYDTMSISTCQKYSQDKQILL